MSETESEVRGSNAVSCEHAVGIYIVYRIHKEISVYFKTFAFLTVSSNVCTFTKKRVYFMLVNSALKYYFVMFNSDIQF